MRRPTFYPAVALTAWSVVLAGCGAGSGAEPDTEPTGTASEPARSSLAIGLTATRRLVAAVPTLRRALAGVDATELARAVAAAGADPTDTEEDELP